MKPRTTRTLTVTGALVAAAAIGAGGGTATFAALGSEDGPTVVRQVTVESSEPAASTSQSLSVSQIYEQSYKGVVEITATSTQSSPTGGEQEQQGQGSGFVYDSDGHIVTNDHVVEGAQSVSVRFWDGSTYDATVVGTDPSTDLAVIKVDAPASKLAPARGRRLDPAHRSATASSRSAARSGSRRRSRAASSAPSTGR